MNPNSISHRLFAAALSPAAVPGKRPVRAAAKNDDKNNAPRPASTADATAPKLSAWTWSGWQHTTI